MRIADMFEKPIDRDIKGVIKVGQDDGENVLQELDEYVVTREMAKHFRDFFEGYRKGIHGHTDKMGVWISGFFGSGKSHFLKILSYLLKNKEVNGKKAIEFFTDGNKLQDPMVIADIKLAGSTSTDVILFNIDSKSEADAKATKDAIIDVLNQKYNCIIAIVPRESKEARLQAVAPMIEAGQVFIRTEDYSLEDEVVDFPNSDHDDEVDAMSQALNRLRNIYADIPEREYIDDNYDEELESVLNF